jgi:hypothetical protein
MDCPRNCPPGRSFSWMSQPTRQVITPPSPMFHVPFPHTLRGRPCQLSKPHRPKLSI